MIKRELKFVRKFTFSDLNLAYNVRATMRAALAAFDVNHNELFEESEIKSALIKILGENEN